MKWHITILLLLLLIPIAFAELTIQTKEYSWNVVKYDGLEADKFYTEYDLVGKDGIRACLIPKETMSINDKAVKDLKVYIKDNSATNIDKTGDTEKETEKGKLKKYCYTTSAQETKHIQFGEKSIHYGYILVEEVAYPYYDDSIRCSVETIFEENLTGQAVELWVKDNTFGLNDTYANGTLRYRKEICYSPVMPVEVNNGLRLGNVLFDDGIRCDLSPTGCNRIITQNLYKNPVTNISIVNWTIETYFSDYGFYDPTFYQLNYPDGSWSQNASLIQSYGFVDMTNQEIFNNTVFYAMFDIENLSGGKAVVDYSNERNQAVIQGGSNENVTGKYGQGYRLNDDYGGSSFLSISNDDTLNFGTSQNFTISMWINNLNITDISYDNAGMLIDKAGTDYYNPRWGKGYQIYYSNSTGNITCNVRQQAPHPFAHGAECAVSFQYVGLQNDWHNIVCVYRRNASCTNNSIEAYIDGVRQPVKLTSNANSNVDISNSYPVLSGWSNRGSGTGAIKVDIDELMIIRDDISPSDVLDIYQETAERFLDNGSFIPISKRVDKGNNQLNLTVPNIQRLLGSNISAQVRYRNTTSQGYNETLSSCEYYTHFDGDRIDVCNGISTSATGTPENNTGLYNYSLGLRSADSESITLTNLPEPTSGKNWTFSWFFNTTNSTVLWNVGYDMLMMYTGGMGGCGFIVYLDDASSGRNVAIVENIGFTISNHNSGTVEYDFGEWNHVALTYNTVSENIILYVNGVKDQEFNPANQCSSGSDKVLGFGFWTYQYFNGSIDEFMYLNKTANEQEVKSLYSCGNLDCLNNESFGVKWSDWTESQYLIDNDNITFTIDNQSENINILYTLESGNNNFYTPLINPVNAIYILFTGFDFCLPSGFSDWIIDGILCELFYQQVTTNGFKTILINSGNLSLYYSNLTTNDTIIYSGSDLLINSTSQLINQ